MKNNRNIFIIRFLFASMFSTSILFAQSDANDSVPEAEKTIHLGFNYQISDNESSGSVSVMDAEKISKSSALNPEEAIFGRIPGLMVLQNGGTIDQRKPTMFIRGKATFRSASPLVIIDGIERELSSLVIDEIENITVLKDAASLAIYGLKGANGVILVTTKRGKYDSYSVNISYDQTINTIFRKPQFLNGYDYVSAVNEASILDGNAPVYSDFELADYQSGNSLLYPSVNWFDESFKDYGLANNFNANFSGGGKASRFFVMLNYQSEEGLFDNTQFTDERYNSDLKYDRFNFRSNLDIDISSSTRFMLNIAGEIINSQRPNAKVDDIMDAIYSVPSAAFPVRTIDDQWGGTEYYDNNPVALINASGGYLSHQINLSSNASLMQDFSRWIKGLSAEVAISYDHNPTFFERKSKDFMYQSISAIRDPLTGAITDTTVVEFGTEADLSTAEGLGWQRRNAAGWAKVNYNTSLGDGVFKSSLLYNMDKKVYTGQYNTYLNQNASVLASYFYKNSYLLDFSMTYGGNNLLPEGSRFGLFPAIAGAWIVKSTETEGNSLLSHLKLRASWGLNGNGAIPSNLFDQRYMSGSQYFFTNNLTRYQGLREGQLASSLITYEESNKTDVGVDVTLFNKLSFSGEFFIEKRTGIRTDPDNVTSMVLGVDNSVSFMGEVENKGFDGSVIFTDTKGDLSYHVGGNILVARNKVLEINEGYKPYDYLYRTGQSVDQQFGLVTQGFFADQTDINNSDRHVFSDVRPGDIKYVDQNDDGIINQYDEVPIGYSSAVPEIYYSGTIGFEFKGIGAEILMQGVANQTAYLNTKSLFWPLRNQTAIGSSYSDRWTPETSETATLPRLSLLDNANNYRKNDIWLTDVSYLKIRYIEIYYQIKGDLAEKIKSNAVKIYVRGSNLYSFDRVSVVDPEATGIVYPTLKSYHFGIRVSF